MLISKETRVHNLCLLIFFILMTQGTIMESFIILPKSAVSNL